MKRVAIIGCSHSDYHCLTDFHKTTGHWVKRCLEKFPNIEFHNYAVSGHSNLYIDMALRYILLYEKYDLIIVQTTAFNRWMMPTGFNGKETVFFDDDNLHRVWHKKHYIKQYKNYYKHMLKLPRIQNRGTHYPTAQSMKEFSVTYVDSEGCSYNASKEWPNEKLNTAEDKVFNLATFFSTMLIKNLEILSNQHPIYYWHFSGWEHMHYTNIGREDTIKECLTSHRDDWKSWVDDTWHLTEEANTYFFNEYLMKSNLGKKLIDLS